MDGKGLNFVIVDGFALMQALVQQRVRCGSALQMLMRATWQMYRVEYISVAFVSH